MDDAAGLAEMRCPCGPSKRGRFLFRYRAGIVQPVVLVDPVTGAVSQPARSSDISTYKCRFCKRVYALRGVRSADDLFTEANVPFSRVGASEPVAVTG